MVSEPKRHLIPNLRRSSASARHHSTRSRESSRIADCTASPSRSASSFRGMGGAVWYVEPGSPMAAALEELLPGPGAATTDPAWQLTPFIELPGPPPDGPFRWEREWRHLGDLKFGPADPSFLFIPEHLHGAASEFFIDAGIQNTGPAYMCTFLDPRWSRDLIEAQLAAVATSL